MTPEQYQAVRKLFEELAELPQAERAERSRVLTTADPEVAQEVAALLESLNNANGYTQFGSNLRGNAQGFALDSLVGGRYRIQALLGQGGMGSVYRAFDERLSVPIALKALHPHVSADAHVTGRFLQEVTLSRSVTHPNVVRIFDLAEHKGQPFLTMELLEGETLDAMLARQVQTEPAKAASIAHGIALGLEAAHKLGVIHRDLKPQNIFLAKAGRVVVMDFGIARVMQEGAQGLTVGGAIIGTPDYMSPEQSLGQPLDARSDLYSLGLVLYRMLSGKLPFGSASSIAALVSRNVQDLPPLPKNVPAKLVQITERCLKRNREERFATAAELASALEKWNGAPALSLSRREAVFAGLGVLAVAGAYFSRDFVLRSSGPKTPRIVRLLLCDFRNETGDENLEGTLEPILSLALEDASFLNTYNRVAARRVAAKLVPNLQRLDEAVARLVAVREGIDVVLSGDLRRAGSEYQVSARLLEVVTGKQLRAEQTSAPRKEALLQIVPRMAAPFREALGDVPVEAQKRTAEETFTVRSLDAAHQYAKAQDLALLGKWEEAISAYQATLKLDPEMGRAWSGIAVVYRNLNRIREAEEHYRKSLQYIDRMTDRERYRTRGGYFVTIQDSRKAVEEYSALVAKYPADNAGYANLALAQFYLRNMQSSLEHGRKAVEIYPKNIAQRNNVALYAMYAGDFKAAIQEAEAVLALDNTFPKAYLAIALSSFALGKREQTLERLAQVEKVSPRGASLASAALIDLAIAEGRVEEAAELALKAAELEESAGNKDAGARRRILLAEACAASGRIAEALRQVHRALIASSDEGVLFSSALLSLEGKDQGTASSIARQFSEKQGDNPRHYGKLLEAWIAEDEGKAPRASELFEEAHKLGDSWLFRWLRGRHYLIAKAYTQASSEFDVCARRQGEALAVFLDDEPSCRYLVRLHYDRGLAEVGLGGKAGASSLQQFLSYRQNASASDKLTAAARARVP
jgi:eukaryotic-like serine/threonine-protein kinase